MNVVIKTVPKNHLEAVGFTYTTSSPRDSRKLQMYHWVG